MKFIFTADLHIRDDQPECRIDRFERQMWAKFNFLKSLQQEHDAQIIVAGDVFHRWNVSPWLINKCLQKLPNDMLVIAGNHDLPYHNLRLLRKSGLETLIRAGKMQIIKRGCTDQFTENVSSHARLPGKKMWHTIKLFPFHYGMTPINVKPEENVIKIAVIHRLITRSKGALWRNTTAQEAPLLLRKLQGYDIIVTGDNHQTFTCRYKHTLLINPGSFTRQTSAQMEHKPCVFLFDTQSRKTTKIILPHDKKAVSRKHLERIEQRNERITAFVSKLNDQYEVSLSYQKNIEAYFEHNQAPEEVQEMVWASYEA